MTFLRAWGLVMVVTVALVAIIFGAAAPLVLGCVLFPAIYAGRVYREEMREWRQHGHPRNRRRAS